jgi:CubicO group peptidase (beta-lactamase class C family)
MWAGLRKAIVGVTAAVLMTPLAAQAQQLTPGQAIPPAELEAFVDGVVRDGMEADHVSGVQVSVVQNGQVVLVKGYGLANRRAGAKAERATDPQRSLFRIGSISKTFTWILLMREVEKGRVKLDAPVNDYLPAELKIPDQGFKPIRIIDLFSHSSGFSDTSFGHLFVDSADQLQPNVAYAATHRPKRVREPGRLSTYSNYSVALATIIVSRLNGVDYQTLVERDILKPLGMNHSSFREPYPARPDLAAPMSPALQGDVAGGFTWTGNGYREGRYEYISHITGVGSGASTASDMARYMLALLNNGQFEGATLYGPRGAALFRTPIMKRPAGVNAWAYGFDIGRAPGGFKTYGHGGNTLYFQSSLITVPDLNLGVFISTNTDSGTPLTNRLPDLLVEHFYVAPHAVTIDRAPDPTFAAKAGLYEGRYLSTRRPYQGLESFVRLLGSFTTVAVTPEGYLTTSGGPIPSGTWVSTKVPGQFIATDSDHLLNFVLDPQGCATLLLEPHANTTMERNASLLLNPGLMPLVLLFALLAAVATWFGAFTRRGRDIHPTAWQARANVVSLATAAAWIVSLVSLGLAMNAAKDFASMMHFPGVFFVAASSAALAAAVGAGLLVLSLPMVWAGIGWGVWRKIRHTLAVLFFVKGSIVLGAWGMLLPWVSY